MPKRHPSDTPWGKDRTGDPPPAHCDPKLRGAMAYPDDYFESTATRILAGIGAGTEIVHRGRFQRTLIVRLVERHARGHSPVHDIAPWQAIELGRNWAPWQPGRGPVRWEHIGISYPYAKLAHHLPPTPHDDPDAWADARAQLMMRVREAEMGEDGRSTADGIRGRHMPWLSHADVNGDHGEPSRVDSAYAMTPWTLAHALLERLDDAAHEPSLAQAGPRLVQSRWGSVTAVRSDEGLLITAEGRGPHRDAPLRLPNPTYEESMNALQLVCRTTLGETEGYRRGERMALVTPGPVPSERAMRAQAEGHGSYRAWRAALTEPFGTALDRLPRADRLSIMAQCEPPVPHAPAGTRHRRTAMALTRPHHANRKMRRRLATMIGETNRRLGDAVAESAAGAT